MAQLWRSQVSGGAAIWAASNGTGTPTVPAFGEITPAATSIVFAYTGPATHWRIYATGGTAGAWVVIGASPVTASGLTTNEPYTIELSSNGSTVAATTNTGTLNPGTGGGEPEPILSALTGDALPGGAIASGSLSGGVTSLLSGTAVVGRVVSTGSITSAAASTLTGAALVGSVTASGSIVSLAPGVLSGTATVGGVVSVGTLQGVVVNTLAVPRLAFRQRTGELFPLLLDDQNVPYAYTRPNGAVVNIRPLDTVSLGVAVNEGTGEMLIII